MGWKPVTAADVEALITEIEGSEVAQQPEGGTSEGQAAATKKKKKKNENGKEANSEDGEEDEDEEEEEVTEVQVGRLLRLFATTNTTTRTSTKTLGTSGGKMMTHTERDRRKRRRGKRKRGAGRGGGPISTTARGPLGSPSDGSAGLWSRVIAAPNSDSTYQVWDFSSAVEDEDQPPWPLDTPASRTLIEVSAPGNQHQSSRAEPSDVGSMLFRRQRSHYTGLHSSVESDSDGYARGWAYSRRSNVPSYAAPSDPLDVYAEVKESAEESGATSNDASTLDELWAGLNDNQAFHSFEQLILQLNHHKEGPHTETQPSGSLGGYAIAQQQRPQEGYRNAAPTPYGSSGQGYQPAGRSAEEGHACYGAAGYKQSLEGSHPLSAYGSHPPEFVLPLPVVPMYPTFAGLYSPPAPYALHTEADSDTDAKPRKAKDYVTSATTTTTTTATTTCVTLPAGHCVAGYAPDLERVGRGRGRGRGYGAASAYTHEATPAGGRGRGRGRGYAPDTSSVAVNQPYQPDSNGGASFWPTSLFSFFSFGATATVPSVEPSSFSDAFVAPSEPTFSGDDAGESNPYANTSGVGYSAMRTERKESTGGPYSSLHSSGYVGSDIQQGGVGAGVRPLLGDLERYCDAPEEDDNDGGEGYTGGYDRSAATDTDSYYAHDGTPYGNHAQHDDDDDEPEENWSDDDADHIAAGGYQRDMSGGSGYDNSHAAAGDSEEAGEPCGREDGVAHHAHDVDYCEQHRPRTSADWDSMARDWTQEFHRIVRGMDDTGSTHDAKKRMHVAEQLQGLYTEFVSVAKAIGETIIRERSLPNALKTIKPSDDFGGIAGGEKFCVAGIFFKFAIDNNNIYGNDGLAAKCAGHELKAASALFSCGMLVGLHSPLVALLDWWGYRLMCYSMLPITTETLAYGSADGGNTVHSGIQELNKRIKLVSRVLNLKGHWAGLAQKRFLYTCCDIEGHRGADGHYYVVDTARLFPPEAPMEGAPPTSFLYRLLRPEFVREYDRPLSSDAFSKFGEDDYQAHNQEVRNATERLKQDVIRRFADELESTVASSSSSSWPYPGDTLVQELHRRGINVRGLALLLNHVTHPRLRARLLSELIARAIKWDVRAAMRGKIKAEMKRARDERRRRAASPPPPTSTATGECRKCALEREMRGMVCECFRRAFADGPAELWARVRSRLCALYPGFAAKAGAEGGEQEEVLRHLSLPDILHRVEAMLGITFSTDLKPGETLGQGRFAEEQLGGIEIRTKEAYVLPRIQADCYALLAARKKSKIDRGGPKKQEALCYFRMAAGLYENVIKCKANDEYALYNWGLALLHGAELEGTADGAREAVSKFGACLDVCRRAVPPNHDLAALGLKAAAECLAYLASLTPTTIAGVEATNKQWLFLQADRHFSAALAILTQLSSSPEASDLAPIPASLAAASSSSSPFDAPASLTADLDAFFSSALPAASAAAAAASAAWVGGDHEDEILRLLYNWANLRRAWAAAGTSGGDDDVRARRRTLLLEASLALYQLCTPAIARWTTSAKSDSESESNAKTSGGGEEWSKGQEDLRAAASHIPTWYSEHRSQPTEVTHQQQPRATKGTREEKEARDHRRRAAQVLANWGVALVELGRTAAAATPTPTPAQLRWWGEAKAKLAAAEGVEPGAGAYNLGCVAALEGNADDSRRWLEKCRRDGRGPAVELWSGDNDLASVRDQAWFKALLLQPEATAV